MNIDDIQDRVASHMATRRAIAEEFGTTAGVYEPHFAAIQFNRLANHAGLTIGELLAKLDQLDGDLPIMVTEGEYPGRAASYRGYYDDLCIDPSTEPSTVAQFAGTLRAAIGTTFHGWKGGEYTMATSTPVWIAHYGDCGPMVIDVVANDKAALIVTREED